MLTPPPAGRFPGTGREQLQVILRLHPERRLCGLLSVTRPPSGFDSSEHIEMQTHINTRTSLLTSTSWGNIEVVSKT